MNEKDKVLKSDDPMTLQKSLQLESGRQVKVHSNDSEELLEIEGSGGELIMKIQLTDAGPVVSFHGANIKLKSTQTLKLESKKIELQAEEDVIVNSNGTLNLNSSDKMDVHSDEEIKVVGKMIHLN